jgi:hypothetical protein
MRVDIPLGLVGTENLPKTKRLLKNCFNNGQGRAIARPGIELISDTNKVSRGSFVWNDSLYHVLSQELVKITDTETGEYSVIGTINGSYPVTCAVGFNHAVLLEKGGESYTLDKSDILTNTSSNANFVQFVGVTHINGRFVYIPANGDPALVSDVGDGSTIQALSYFDAEELPDKNNGCFNLSNTLFITGTDSIELFRDAGLTPNPFQRVTGARIQNGYIGGLLEYNGTFLFVGREKDHDYGIYAIGQGQAPKISNETIDLILSTYTQQELSETVSSRFKWRGYDLAVFTLRRHCLGFYGGNWFVLSTLIDGDERTWGAGYVTHFNGDYYTSRNGILGKLSTVNTDYGKPIPFVIEFALEQERNNQNDGYFEIDSVELGISQGFSDKGSVGLQLSKDGVLFGAILYRETGAVGEYDSRLKWQLPGGLGQYEGFAMLRFYSTEAIDFSIDYIDVVTS